jgi:cold shock CspA family protein
MTEDAAKLMAEKIVRELFRLSQAYGQALSPSFDDLLHDFTVMIRYDDLATVRLIFHDGQRRALLEYVYHIQAGTVVSNSPHDPVGGLAVVPLTVPFSLNLVITYKRKERTYTSQLRIRWSDAPTYTHNGGDQCNNPHFGKKTGGRAGSDIYADHNLRRRGRVKCFSAEKQYGFIIPDERGAPEVFVHASATNSRLQAGERVSYLPLITPRGIQARAVLREG